MGKCSSLDIGRKKSLRKAETAAITQIKVSTHLPKVLPINSVPRDLHRLWLCQPSPPPACCCDCFSDQPQKLVLCRLLHCHMNLCFLHPSLQWFLLIGRVEKDKSYEDKREMLTMTKKAALPLIRLGDTGQTPENWTETILSPKVMQQM